MTDVQSDNCRAADLDGEKLGAIVFKFPLISKYLRHTSLESTLGYVGDVSLEMEFLRDFLTLPTQDLIDRWYGGDEGALRAMALMQESAFGPFVDQR
jgi:hypothetical protein